MCKVCVEWEAGKLTSKEALNALGEMMRAEEDEKKSNHYLRAVDKVLDKEVPMADTNEELDKTWHEETHAEE